MARTLSLIPITLALASCSAPPQPDNRGLGQKVEEALRGKEAIARDREAAKQSAQQQARARLSYDAALNHPVDLPVAASTKQFALIERNQPAIRALAWTFD